MKYLPATEIKNRFGRILRELKESGEPFVVERAGKPVAVIMSLDEYEQKMGRAVQNQDEDLIQQAFGMWANRDDLDDDWFQDGRSRWKSAWADA